MKVLREAGGVCIFGDTADDWEDPAERRVGAVPVEFDSDVSAPCVATRHARDYFEFPCCRGEEIYVIHLLESGEALVIKDDKHFLCTIRDGKPRVLEFAPAPADRKVAMSDASGLHPSHKVRYSDASTFDTICVNCHRTDHVPGGWGELALPCPNA